jgi:8-oxo-dGTP pyrophosphatase MutT (NUDIX family)
MTSTPPENEIAVPRPAASVLLVRDGAEGIEVFMATRHAKSSFMPGALVFPGGSVDAADSHPLLMTPGAGEDAVWRVAAIRETFEEAGFLLARAAGELVGPVRLAKLDRTWRQRLCRGEIEFPTMVAAEALALAPDLIIPFGHWVTPQVRSKRFDTRFYLARAPEGQAGIHDARELVDSRWVRPLDALAERDEGKIQLVFATRANLGRLAESRTVDEALAVARTRRIVPVEPELFDAPRGRSLRIPVEAGYALSEILARDSGL